MNGKKKIAFLALLDYASRATELLWVDIRRPRSIRKTNFLDNHQVMDAIFVEI